jgi:hypothetical protein
MKIKNRGCWIYIPFLSGYNSWPTVQLIENCLRSSEKKHTHHASALRECNFSNLAVRLRRKYRAGKNRVPGLGMSQNSNEGKWEEFHITHRERREEENCKTHWDGESTVEDIIWLLGIYRPNWFNIWSS